MKTKTIFKSMMMAVCCLGIVTLASCKDDKDERNTAIHGKVYK